MTQVYQEYQNQNRYRKYPFVDHATLQATNGVTLPTDFLLDAILYPIDLANELYIQSIDFGAKEITFADSVTGTVHGTAIWDTADQVAYVYDNSGYSRMVGILTLGDGRLNQSVGGVLTFLPAATAFTPTAVYPLNQPGVRGILLDDGNFLTGPIQFQGRNGVSVRSYVDDAGRSVIAFDITGVPEPVEDCFDCAMVRCIEVTTSAGSYLIAASCGSNAVCITTPFELTDVCPPANISLPSERKDPCVTPEPCPPVEPTSGTDTFTICPSGGRLYIITPSAPAYDNPLWVETTEDPAPPPDHAQVTEPKGLSPDARENILRRMFDAMALSRGKIKLGYRGLTTGRHY